MTATYEDYMPLDRQLFARSLGEIMASLARQKYPTAKLMARDCGMDPTTAENVRKAHLSIPSLQKVVQAEEAKQPGGGWALWEALGTELLGETYEQYQERRLRTIIEQAEHARENLTRLRTRRAALDERTRELDGTWDRKGA